MLDDISDAGKVLRVENPFFVPSIIPDGDELSSGNRPYIANGVSILDTLNSIAIRSGATSANKNRGKARAALKQMYKGRGRIH